MYKFGFIPLLPMLTILICTLSKSPPVPSMLLSSAIAIAVGWLYQGFDLWQGVSAAMRGFEVEMIGFDSSQLDDSVLKLLHRGGLNTQGDFLAFIICAMAFAGILTGTKMIDVAMRDLTRRITTTRAAILGAGGIAVAINGLTGSDGLNKVITAEVMNKRFLDLRLHPKVLARTLEDFGVAWEAEVVSAHRTPDKLVSYATSARSRGLKVIIGGAGGAAHLPGMVASMTILPVLGVPVESSALKGMDSLLSIVQMPGGIPVATFAIGKAGARNAGLYAVATLALGDAQLAERLEAFRRNQTETVLNARLD